METAVSQPRTALTDFLNGRVESSARIEKAFEEQILDKLQKRAEFLARLENLPVAVQAGDLISQAWLELRRQNKRVENRQHYVGCAILAMHQFLKTNARYRNAAKRGGRQQALLYDDAQFDQMLVSGAPSIEDSLALHEMLEHLAQKHSQRACVVSLHLIQGLSLSEAAKLMGLPEGTAKSHYRLGLAELRRLSTSSGNGAGDPDKRKAAQ